MSITPQNALLQTRERLAELFDALVDDVHVERERGFVVAVMWVADYSFLVEWKASGSAAAVVSGIRALALRQAGHSAIPLLVVPFMGDVGRRWCSEAGVTWLDLSGNARIVVPGLRIIIDGQPNRFTRRGRPSNAFAPKSARVTRWLLMHPDKPLTQRELGRQAGVDEGFTSRIVGRLLDMELVARDADGRVSVPDPSVLLDAWSEHYRFERHHLVKGHVAARSGDELTRKLVSRLEKQDIRHAFTGLVAAWQWTHFAMFRLASVYLPDGASPSVVEALGVREDARGANVWLLVPDDEGVVLGASIVDGVCCVHPVQTWLDLGSHPERAVDAAERIRDLELHFRRDA